MFKRISRAVSRGKARPESPQKERSQSRRKERSQSRPKEGRAFAKQKSGARRPPASSSTASVPRTRAVTPPVSDSSATNSNDGTKKRSVTPEQERLDSSQVTTMVLFDPNDDGNQEQPQQQNLMDERERQMVVYDANSSMIDNESESRMVVYSEEENNNEIPYDNLAVVPHFSQMHNEAPPPPHSSYGPLVPAQPRTVATRGAGSPAHLDHSFSMESGVTMEPDDILTTASSLTDIDMYTGGATPLGSGPWTQADQRLLDDLNRWQQQASALGINDFELPGDYAQDADDDGYPSLTSGEPGYAGVFRGGMNGPNDDEEDGHGDNGPRAVSPTATSQVNRLRGKAINGSPSSQPHSNAKTLNPVAGGSPQRENQGKTRSPMTWRNMKTADSQESENAPGTPNSKAESEEKKECVEMEPRNNSGDQESSPETQEPTTVEKKEETDVEIDTGRVLSQSSSESTQISDSTEEVEKLPASPERESKEETVPPEEPKELHDNGVADRSPDRDSKGSPKPQTKAMEEPKSSSVSPDRGPKDGPKPQKKVREVAKRLSISPDRESEGSPKPQKKVREVVNVNQSASPVRQSKKKLQPQEQTKGLSATPERPPNSGEITCPNSGGKARRRPSVVVVNPDSPENSNRTKKQRRSSNFGKMFRSFRRKKSSKSDLLKDGAPPTADEDPADEGKAQLTPATMDSECESDADSKASRFSFRIVGVVDEAGHDEAIPSSNGANTAATATASDDASTDSEPPPQYFQPMQMYNDKEVSPAVVELPKRCRPKGKYSTPAIEQLRKKKEEASSKAKQVQSLSKSRSSSLLQKQDDAQGQNVSWFVCYESDSEDQPETGPQIPFMMLPVGKRRDSRPSAPAVAERVNSQAIVPFVSFVPHVQTSKKLKLSSSKVPVGSRDGSRMRNKLFSHDRVKKMVASGGRSATPEPSQRHAHILEKKPSAVLLGKAYTPSASVQNALSALESLEVRKAALRSKMRNGFSPEQTSTRQQIVSH